MAFRGRRILQHLSVGAFRLQCRVSSASSPILSSAKPAYNLTETPEEHNVEDQMKAVLQYPDYFKVSDLFTVEDLFKARVQLGHKDGSYHKNMTPYIFGSRLGHLIIDLDQTAEHLRQALNFTAHIAFRGGIVLFVCRIPQHQVMVEKFAQECGEYAHTRFWKAGILTDSNNTFGCVTRLPDLFIFLNTLDTVMQQHLAVSHAAKMLIPTVGIVDTNCDPNLITYPVPGNDDTTSSIQLYCNLFKNAILRGKAKRKELLE